MPVVIQRNDLPPEVRERVAEEIVSAIGEQKGIWLLDMTSEPQANAWDIEVFGPNKFNWARRFSGADRDSDVISEAVRSAVADQAAA